MKEKEKKKLPEKIFNVTFTILFVTFLTMYFGNKMGYFEYKKNEQVFLTQEQIKQFEQDVKDGKEIDLESYLINTNKNYQTKLSKTGLTISNGVSKVVRTGVENLFESINRLVTETEY